MKHNRKERELEAARNAKILELYLSEAEGRACLCGHPPAFHWKNSQGENLGKCAIADCGCDAYDEDVFAGIGPGREKRDAADETDDENALARAMQAETLRATDDQESWDRALRAAENPRAARRQTQVRQPPKRDRAVRDALCALGGELEDLSDSEDR